MDLEKEVTVTNLNINGERCYLLIAWQTFSFEMYLYIKEKLWKGSFSPIRLSDFSKNLRMTEDAYFKRVKSCLSQTREDYSFEIKSDFFYWKRQLKDSVLIEGFLPVEVDTSPKKEQPDLIETLMALNNKLNNKANHLQHKYSSIKHEYQRCLKETEQFLNLKIEMEVSVCNKFVNLLSTQNKIQ